MPRKGGWKAHHLTGNLNNIQFPRAQNSIQLRHFLDRSDQPNSLSIIPECKNNEVSLLYSLPQPPRNGTCQEKRLHHLRFVAKHHRRSIGGPTPSRGFSWSDDLSTDRFADERTVHQEAAELARSDLRRVIPVHAHLCNVKTMKKTVSTSPHRGKNKTHRLAD